VRILHAAWPHREGYLANALVEAGHVVEATEDLASLLLAGDEDYDAVLVEADVPGDLPLERIVRATGRAVLVLIVERASAIERTRALRQGADACFARPVQFMELEARLAALVRLAHGRSATPNDLALDPASRTARMGDQSVMLSAREFALLDYLAGRGGEPASAEQILEQLWGGDSDGGAERVRTTVARLRARLAEAFGAPLIVSVRGHGYRLQAKMKLSSSA
jgi:DNA-binding response OmpR family regulator